MNCTEIKKPGFLQKLLIESSEPIPGSVVKCLFEMYFEYFEKFAHKNFLMKYSFESEKKNGLVMDAFIETIETFIPSIRTKGFEERESTFSSYFIEFSKNRLMGLIKKQIIENQRLYSGDPDIIIERKESSIAENPVLVKEFFNSEDEKIKLFEKGISLLDENCRNLIINRKFNKINKDQVAKTAGVSVITVNNSLYRCKLKLKSIIDKLKLIN